MRGMRAPRILLCARAPAKVNLVLRVGARRRDGYHDLDTLMVPLDLADDVRVEIRRGCPGAVACRVPDRPDLDGPSNLAARAAEAFRRRYVTTDRVEITIQKRIPVTAGLGGGSSDAATVLRALARAYEVRDPEGLLAAGLQVGSDVPFFLGRGPAWATGRGERLTPAEVPTLDLVVLYPRDPSVSIRAADAYRWLDASRQSPASRLPLDARARARWTPSAAVNDLEGPCLARHPRLAELEACLVGHGATAAIMSGSGPAVFGVFPDRTAARRAARGAREMGLEADVHVVRTLMRHPGVSRWKSPRSACSPSTRRS